MKRFLSAVLTLVVIISLLSIPVSASSATDLADAANNVVGKSYSDLGLPSSNWCGYFVGYCINNSSVSSLAGEQVSRANSANAMTLINWTCAIKNIGTYYSLSSPHYTRLTNAYKNLSIESKAVNDYEPAAGDIIVFDWNGRDDSKRIFSHVGIVTGYDVGSAKVTYVDGNSGTGKYTYVVKKTAARTYNAIIGYIRLNEAPPLCVNGHSYDSETCTVCGTTVSYDNGYDASAAGTYKVIANTAYVRTGPYQAKDLVRTMNKDETVEIVASVINSYGNLWYRTSEGHYIHAEKMSKVDANNKDNKGHWGSWSEWSSNYVEASTTREVETRQVTVSEGHMEYRYGRYVDSAGRHDCWCSTYLENMKDVTGSAILQYSDWSTTQYSPARPHWTCGFCRGEHANVDHYTDDGRAWWKQFIVPSGSYYWEESRWVEPVSETQYRYRDWIAG